MVLYCFTVRKNVHAAAVCNLFLDEKRWLGMNSICLETSIHFFQSNLSRG